MPKTEFQKAIFESLTQEYEQSIPPHDEHEFSPKFQKKMQKLMKRRRKPYFKIIDTTGKRIVCAVIGVFLACSVTVTSASAIKRIVSSFHVETLRRFSNVNTFDAEGVEDSPQTIEDIYEITYDLSGYTYDICWSDETSRCVDYIKGNDEVTFFQDVQLDYDVAWNTENAEIIHIQINGHPGIYYCDLNGYNTYIWDNDDYILAVSSNLDKEEVREIVESVQKVE